MRHRLAITLVLLLAIGSLAVAPAAAAPDDEPEAAPDQLLVGYRRGSTPAQREAARQGAGGRLLERVVPGGGERLEVELVSLPRGADRGQAERRFESNPVVAYAEPNWKVTIDQTSPPDYYANGSLWGMYGDGTSPANQYGSQAGETWAAGNTGSDIVYVGVIDEGIDIDHPDLAANIWVNPKDPVDGTDNDGNGYVDDVNGYDFFNNDATVDDGAEDNHGTHVAGTIGADMGASGVVGVAPDVTLISGKFLGPDGGYTSGAIKAVDYFTDLKTRHHLNIVATNNSWGGGGYSESLYQAIEAANTANILFIAAAGNSGQNNDRRAHYPSNYPNSNVISVASITSTGGLSSFSNYGKSTVDIGAPGSGIWSTVPDGGYASYNGTSMATPHVTGGAVLYAALYPTATDEQVKAALLDAAVPTDSLGGKTATGGRLDVSGFAPAPGGETPPAANTAPVASFTYSCSGLTCDFTSTSTDADGADDIASYAWDFGDGANATGATTPHTFAAGGDYTVTLTVTDSAAATDSEAHNVTVTAPPTHEIALTVSPYKVKGEKHVDLVWGGATSTSVDVLRDGTRVITTENDGALTHSWGAKGGGSHTFQVCEAGTTACSPVVTATF